MLLSEENTCFEVTFPVPFIVDKETFDTNVEVKGCDESQLSLQEWNCTEVNEDSEISLVKCVFNVDSQSVLELDNLPVVEVTLSDKEGFRKHWLVCNLLASKLNSLKELKTFSIFIIFQNRFKVMC